MRRFLSSFLVLLGLCLLVSGVVGATNGVWLQSNGTQSKTLSISSVGSTKEIVLKSLSKQEKSIVKNNPVSGFCDNLTNCFASVKVNFDKDIEIPKEPNGLFDLVFVSDKGENLKLDYGILLNGNDFWGQTLRANEDYLIEIRAVKPAERWVDWVLVFNGLKYSDWAWWVNPAGLNCKYRSDVNISAPITLQDKNASIRMKVPDVKGDGYLVNIAGNWIVDYNKYKVNTSASDSNFWFDYNSSVGLNLFYYNDCDTNFTGKHESKVLPAQDENILNDGNSFDHFDGSTKGIATNITYSTTRVSGTNSASFNGSNSGINYGASWVYNAVGTIEFWAYPTTLTGNSFLYNQADNTIYLQWNINLSLGFRSNGIQNAVYNDHLKLNNWTHFAITWDGANTKLYLDGNLASTLGTGTGILNDEFHLGYNNLYPHEFAGLIDEFRVSKIVRTQFPQKDLNSNSVQPVASLGSGVLSGSLVVYSDINVNGKNFGVLTSNNSIGGDSNHLISFRVSDADSNYLSASIYYSGVSGGKENKIIDLNLLAIGLNPSSDYNCGASSSNFGVPRTCWLNWNILSPPVGDGNYFIDVSVSDENLLADNNSSVNSFKVIGVSYLSFNFVDENSFQKLLGLSISFNGNTYYSNESGKWSISLIGLPTGRYSISASSLLYGSRSWVFDLDSNSRIDLNVLMAKSAWGINFESKSFLFQFIDVNGFKFVNSKIEVKRDVNFAGIGFTDSEGKISFYLNSFDYNYYFRVYNSSGTSYADYNAVVLTVKVPKSEEDLSLLDKNNFSVGVLTIASQSFSGLSADQNLKIFPFTASGYMIKVDLNSTYFSRYYAMNSINGQNVVLQPFLVRQSTASPITIETRSVFTGQALPNIKVVTKKNLSGYGLITVESKYTGVDGKAFLYLIAGGFYDVIEFYSDNTRLRQSGELEVTSTSIIANLDLTSAGTGNAINYGVVFTLNPSDGNLLVVPSDGNVSFSGSIYSLQTLSYVNILVYVCNSLDKNLSAVVSSNNVNFAFDLNLWGSPSYCFVKVLLSGTNVGGVFSQSASYSYSGVGKYSLFNTLGSFSDSIGFFGAMLLAIFATLLILLMLALNFGVGGDALFFLALIIMGIFMYLFFWNNFVVILLYALFAIGGFFLYLRGRVSG